MQLLKRSFSASERLIRAEMESSKALGLASFVPDAFILSKRNLSNLAQLIHPIGGDLSIETTIA